LRKEFNPKSTVSADERSVSDSRLSCSYVW